MLIQPVSYTAVADTQIGRRQAEILSVHIISNSAWVSGFSRAQSKFFVFGFPTSSLSPVFLRLFFFWTHILDARGLQHVVVACNLPRHHMKQIQLLLLLSRPKLLVGGDYLKTFLPAMFPPLPNTTILWITADLHWQRKRAARETLSRGIRLE